MSRAPQYHEDHDRRFRIISVHNDQWVPQRRGEGEASNKYVGEGTKKNPEKPHYDGWISIARPMDRAKAETFMNEAAGHAATKH